MTPDQAHAFLTQLAQDYINTLAPPAEATQP